MERKGVLDRFKRLSKPTGSPKWRQAVRSIILMVLAGAIAYLLGFDNGIDAIMFITLLASIIIDIPLPIRKVAILTVLGIFMTALAFLSASLALSSLEIFIFFTVIWAFFSISLYIFGTTEGSIGFTFFLIYFTAVLFVNEGSNPIEWAIYSIFPYLIVSILFIPKLWLEKKRIGEMVTVGFIPTSSITGVFLNRSILSGISLKSNYYDIFKLGSYLKGLRTYSDLMTSRLPSKSQKNFRKFLNISDKLSLNISNNFKSNSGSVDLNEIDTSLLEIKSQFLENKAVTELSQSIRDILEKSNEVLTRTPGKETRKIETSKKSLKEVLEANFNINNLYIRHAIRFTLAITIGLIVVYITRERSAIWITMGILIILKPDIASTVDNLISRVGFNLLAIMAAIIISFIFPHNLLIWFAFIMLFFFRVFYPSYMGLSIIAITVFIVLIWPTGTVFENAVSRLVDISIGGIIAFICAYMVLPSRITVNLPDQLLKTIKANIEYASQILDIPNTPNTQNTLKCLKNYIMEDNNLEAAIKKLEDTFYDINDDLKLYNEIMLINKKIAADLTVMSALLNKNPEKLTNSNLDIINVKDALYRFEVLLNGDIKLLKSNLDNIKLDHLFIAQNDDLNQLLNWIMVDIQLLINLIDVALETGALERYSKLS